MDLVIGACQLNDIQGDITVAQEQVIKSAQEAETQGVNILCFPECFLQGYTLDINETKRRALSLKSIAFKELLNKLTDYKVTIILGLIEKDGANFYNTAAIIRHGGLLGAYRKVHLFEQNFLPGSEYPIFSNDDIKFGVNICYDARFPEGAKALVEKGAQVILYPLNNRLPAKKAIEYRDKHIPNLVERAKETDCWIVSSDVIAQDDTHIGYGCTVIVNPEGKVVARAKELEQQMIFASI